MALSDTEVNKINDLYKQLDEKQAQLDVYAETTDAIVAEVKEINKKLDTLLAKTTTKKK